MVKGCSERKTRECPSCGAVKFGMTAWCRRCQRTMRVIRYDKGHGSK